AAIQEVGPPFALGIEDRNVLLARKVHQTFNIGHRAPAGLAAMCAIAVEPLEDRLPRLIAAEIVLHIDDEEGRPRAKTAALPIARLGVDLLVAFAEEIVPNPLCHTHLQ